MILNGSQAVTFKKTQLLFGNLDTCKSRAAGWALGPV